jgi:hypothetical protein
MKNAVNLLLDLHFLVRLTWRVVEPLQLNFFERDDVLLVVLLLADDDIAVDEDVVEEEELSWLRPFAAHLCENAFANQHSTRNEQLFPGTAETALHHLYSSGICLAVHCGNFIVSGGFGSFHVTIPWTHVKLSSIATSFKSQFHAHKGKRRESESTS